MISNKLKLLIFGKLGHVHYIYNAKSKRKLYLNLHAIVKGYLNKKELYLNINHGIIIIVLIVPNLKWRNLMCLAHIGFSLSILSEILIKLGAINSKKKLKRKRNLLHFLSMAIQKLY